ncbi:MAG: hypothetical protein AAGC72_01150 [Planctomycetota bacterium]
MAHEILTQERLSAKSVEISVLITGAASASAARTEAIGATSPTENGLPRRLIDINVDEQGTQDGGGNQDYIVTVPYGTGGGSQNSDLDVGDTRILYSTVGGSVHITQSLETKASYGDAEDHEEAIGVDHEGNVTGTDILNGAFDFSIIKVVNASSLTSSYISSIASLNTPNPHTNNATFSHEDSAGRVVGGDEGELLFIGFRNSPRGDGTDELQFDFKRSDNLTDALPATAWTVVKDGWDHLWVAYKRAEDLANNKIVTVPASAYVEKVYPAGDYSLLNI